MRGVWTIENTVNAKLRARLAQVLEEAPPAAEQHGGQGDFHFVDDTQVQVLLDHVRAARDANIAATRRVPGLLERTLRAVVDEVERRASRPDPRFTLLAVSTYTGV